MSQQHLTEKLATSILAREGVAAIWALHVAAADAHQTGHARAAAAILEIAEAAENQWLSARQHLRARLADVIGSLENNPLCFCLQQPLSGRDKSASRAAPQP